MNTAEIRLTGMSFFAHHGYYMHEQVRGNNFLVDVSLMTNIDKAAIHDDLHETVNYEVIYNICSVIMDQPCKLIETVVYRIAHEIKASFPHTNDIRVSVYKLTPELGGTVQNAVVTYHIP